MNKIDEFLNKLEKALAFYGKPINGLERAKLRVSLIKKPDLEKMLEMMETIRKHEETIEAIKNPRLSPDPVQDYSGNKWTLVTNSSNTSAVIPNITNVTGTFVTGTSIKG